VNEPASQQAQQPETIVCDHSSWLKTATYDPKSLKLWISFQNGETKTFYPIYPQTFLDFKLSPSKGKFYAQAIKSQGAPQGIV